MPWALQKELTHSGQTLPGGMLCFSAWLRSYTQDPVSLSVHSH
uniref:Uncharacterized protein n=1 Tax=Anguilla anguilla TaxID=7936 RepID=A0A0E9U3B4_ANGAN